MESQDNRLQKLFKDLTGELPWPLTDTPIGVDALFEANGIGYSQFNELLLLLNYDRIERPFFQFLVNGATSYNGSPIRSFDHLCEGIDRFRKLAILRFGNIKYSFQNLSRMTSDELTAELAVLEPRDDKEYAGRLDPVMSLQEITGDDAYYLGYIVARELQRAIEKNPDDADAKAGMQRRDSIVAVGTRNHEAYLASDYMDVYVATSMRERHEFFMVNAIAKKIFADERLTRLNLRWFNPTQAYCHDRLDKGLSEALMLKRASCTLYLAQESDTLGKDSELASTLAQGKPVVAFVPQIDKEGETVGWMLNAAQRLYKDKTRTQLILHQLQVFMSSAAWEDKKVRRWLDDPTAVDQDKALQYLTDKVAEHYEKRAKTLKDDHPLGLQVDLGTGVANGVLVARTTEECAELIYRILTNTLEFRLEEKTLNGKLYLLLRERVSGSIFRVVTGDPLLTNAFWNFYLDE